MAHYFFNLHDDIVSPDTEGGEFTGVEQARQHAVVGARDLMATQIRSGRIDLSHWIGITDSGGNEVARVRFGDVVTIEGL